MRESTRATRCSLSVERAQEERDRRPTPLPYVRTSKAVAISTASSGFPRLRSNELTRARVWSEASWDRAVLSLEAERCAVVCLGRAQTVTETYDGRYRV